MLSREWVAPGPPNSPLRTKWILDSNKIGGVGSSIYSHADWKRATPQELDNRQASIMEELKEKGNACMREGQVSEAIEYYTEAIKLEATAILYSNRSNAYLKLRKFYEANRDAEEAISLDPMWSKGYFRFGEVRLGVQQLKEAVTAYETAQLLHQRQHGRQDLLLARRLTEARAQWQQQRKLEQHLAWLCAGVGLIVSVLVIASDYALAKAPVMTHVVVQSAFVLVLSGVGYGGGLVWVWYRTHLRATALQPLLSEQLPTSPTGGLPTHPSGGLPTHPSGGLPTHPSGGLPTHLLGGLPTHPSGGLPLTRQVGCPLTRQVGRPLTPQRRSVSLNVMTGVRWWPTELLLVFATAKHRRVRGTRRASPSSWGLVPVARTLSQRLGACPSDWVLVPTTGACPSDWGLVPATGGLSQRLGACPSDWEHVPATGSMSEQLGACPSDWEHVLATGSMS
ncbi:Tetratricopeptide repeat [Trinorchestia longiramus]|nr:Tetratricopeptide repeat [Trinorchestia longiramus]